MAAIVSIEFVGGTTAVWNVDDDQARDLETHLVDQIGMPDLSSS